MHEHKQNQCKIGGGRKKVILKKAENLVFSRDGVA